MSMGERERVQQQAHEEGLPFVDLDRIVPDRAARSVFALETLTEFEIVPLKLQEGNLWVATSNPHSIRSWEPLALQSKLRLWPVLAVRTEILNILESWALETNKAAEDAQ